MNTAKDFTIILSEKLFDQREKDGTMLEALCSKIEAGKEINIDNFKGFDLLLRKNIFYEKYDLILHGNSKYTVEVGGSHYGSMTRLENALNSLENKMKYVEERIEEYKRNMEQFQKEFEKPFKYGEELKSKIAR